MINTLKITFLAACALSLSANAATIVIDNIDPDAGTYSDFVSTATDANTFSLTRTFDFDSGGIDDTLTFTLTRTTYAAGSITGADVTVGTVNNGGNTNNWYSNFGDRESTQFAVSGITYSSGEMDGTTVVFDGFQNITRTNINDAGASISYLVHTGSVGSTTITTTGTALDLTSGGSASSLFITAEEGAPGIRLRDLDLQFSTAAIPEPSSTALLGLGGLALILRRRR
ncbi:MAG: PEP-CTERM sorting domain-containing protein [Luteolibacter sp.]